MHPKMPIKTPRLTIDALRPSDVYDIQRNSLDDDNRRFVPDEVFETLDDAKETVDWLVNAAKGDGPYVCPVRLADGECIGYVQLCPIDIGWEVGYHIAARHTGKGYATEALAAFLPAASEAVDEAVLYGEVLEENAASCRVLEKCGFKLEFRGRGKYQGETRDIRQYTWRRE